MANIVTDPELIARLEAMSQGGSPQPAEQAPLGFGEMVGQAVTNAPGSALELGKNIVEPIIHPVQTVKGIGQLAQGLGAKLVPGEQESEGSVDALVDFVSQRYGGLENVKRTFAQDPVGFLADFALLATGGGAAVKALGTAGKVSGLARAGEIAGQVGRAVDPISTAATLAGKTYGAVAKAVPALAPEKLVMSTLKKAPLSSKLTPDQQLANAQTALEHGIDVGSRSGLEKLWGKMDEMDTAIGAQIDAAAGAGDTIPKALLFKKLQAMKGADSPYGVHPDSAVFAKVINKTIYDTAKQFPTGDIPVAAVQKLKTNVQRTVRDFYGKTGNIKKEAQKALAADARKALADKYPELAALNKTDASLHQLEKALEGAVTRIEARDLLGLGMTSKVGAGTGVGLLTGDVIGAGAGATAGVVLGLLDTPAVKGKLALALDRARKAEMAAKYSRAAKVRQGALASERLTQDQPANATGQ